MKHLHSIHLFALFMGFGFGCASSTAVTHLKMEDFSSTGNARTFDNQIYNNIGARRTELNLELEQEKKCKYNFLLSIYWVPVVNDPIAVEPGGTLEISADKSGFEYASAEGSRENTQSSAMGVGKQETVRFEDIPRKELVAILEGNNVHYKVFGKNQTFTGQIPAASLKVLRDFYGKTKGKCK